MLQFFFLNINTLMIHFTPYNFQEDNIKLFLSWQAGRGINGLDSHVGYRDAGNSAG